MPAAIEPPPVSAEEGPVEADITPHLGTYERAGVIMEVMAGTEKHDGPTLRTTVTGPIAEMVPDPVDEYAMTPVGPDLWLVREPGTQTWAPVTFPIVSSRLMDLPMIFQSFGSLSATSAGGVTLAAASATLP